jgi:hypothetical protein
VQTPLPDISQLSADEVLTVNLFKETTWVPGLQPLFVLHPRAWLFLRRTFAVLRLPLCLPHTCRL